MSILEWIVWVLAYGLGCLPLGYWLYKRQGFHPRAVAAHNLGIENVWRVLGMEAASLSFAADFLKGLLAVALTLPFNSPNVSMIAGLAVLLGHFYPPISLFRDVLKDIPPRGRGNIVLLGVLAGLYATADFPLWSLMLPLAVFGALLGYSRLTTLSSVAALFTLALTSSFLALDSALEWNGVLAAWAIVGMYVWRSKENLGRALDGTEPLLGEAVPMTGKNPDQVVAAFMIHPMSPADFWQAGRFKLLYNLIGKYLPESWILASSEYIRPMKVDELRGIYTLEGKEIRTYLIAAPLLPSVITSKPELAVKRAIQAAQLAQELGASTFGLGAFWSTVGNKGLDVQAAVPEICVTNGGAYTAGTVRAAIPSILEHFKAQGRDLGQVTAAVVGANGVVAFGIARTIAAQVGKVILVGRDLERLNRSKLTLERACPNTVFVATLEVAEIVNAELIFSATSDPDPVIFAQHVRPGAWIFDEGRPADVDDSVKTVPGVRIIPGGLVRPPGAMTQRLDIHFGEGQVPACLAETLIIAANQAFERKSLGPQTSGENIAYFIEQAERLGFEVVD